MADGAVKELTRHFKEVKNNYSNFLKAWDKDIKCKFDETNLKLNFINMTIKSIFGGDRKQLLGFIGEVDNLERKKILNIETCIYKEDDNIALITNLCWLGGVESKIPALWLTKDKDEFIDILTYFMVLTDVIGLKVGYVCYKDGDKEENTFKKFGFIQTDLRTDKDCYILVKEPRELKWLNKNK